MAVTPEQEEVIRAYLDQGMSPEDIANSLGRMSDADNAEIEEYRSVAIRLSHEPDRNAP